MSTLIRTERRKRSPWGEFVKWVFIAFNVLMLLWLISALHAVSQVTAPSDAARVGHAVGSVIGISMVLALWVIGDAILGAFVLLTRGNKVIVEETSTVVDARFGEEPGISTAQADAMIARYVQSRQHGTQRQSPNPDFKVFGRRR
jgi:hypothetical protein